MPRSSDFAQYPKITDEWVRQLGLIFFGVRNVRGIVREYNIYSKVYYMSVPPDPKPARDWGTTPISFSHEIDTVNMITVVDEINKEVHRIGYGEKSNVLVVYQETKE